MDPRIHWEDILMRMEIPNRTTRSDSLLQNATNNLINRKQNKELAMLAWHSTGANAAVRRNAARTEVLGRVNNARPPLPPNSTRGLTPGLIDPRRGHVSGNMIAFPDATDDRRLRVNMPRQAQFPAAAGAAANTTIANPAQANPAPANMVQANPTQANQSQTPTTRHSQGRNVRHRDSRRHGKVVPQKRRNTAHTLRGRPLKRPAIYEGSSGDDEMGSDSEESMSLEVFADDSPILQVSADFKGTRVVSHQGPWSATETKRSQV